MTIIQRFTQQDVGRVVRDEVGKQGKLVYVHPHGHYGKIEVGYSDYWIPVFPWSVTFLDAQEARHDTANTSA